MDNGHRMDDRPWLYYKLTNEHKGSGELKNKYIFKVITSFDCAINPLFSAIKSIHCFDMKSHSIPIKHNDIDNQLFTLLLLPTCWKNRVNLLSVYHK